VRQAFEQSLAGHPHLKTYSITVDDDGQLAQRHPGLSNVFIAVINDSLVTVDQTLLHDGNISINLDGFVNEKWIVGER